MKIRLQAVDVEDRVMASISILKEGQEQAVT